MEFVNKFESVFKKSSRITLEDDKPNKPSEEGKKSKNNDNSISDQNILPSIYKEMADYNLKVESTNSTNEKKKKRNNTYNTPNAHNEVGVGQTIASKYVN